MMKPISEWPLAERQKITHLFTDLDETVTYRGILKAQVYYALERLDGAGIKIIVVTGRPAGWCDLIARIWPVAGAIAESGGLAIRRTEAGIERLYWQEDNQHQRLHALKQEALKRFPFARLSTDSHYREIDIAFDHSEEPPAMTKEQVKLLGDFFIANGAQIAASSIHLHAWFGNFSKYAMSKKAMQIWWQKSIEADSPYIFVGDSLNDATMFEHFPHTIGVANIKKVVGSLSKPPHYITKGEGGEGFLEIADLLLEGR